jgi:predicted metal-dependent hydrolase
MKLIWNRGPLAEGLRCYRDEEFFLAHEHWESVWLQCQEPEKTFLQSLIQIAAAFHHLKNKNSRGATSLLKRALRRLEPYPAEFEGLEVALLRQELQVWLHALATHDSAPRLPFPKIRPDSDRTRD